MRYFINHELDPSFNLAFEEELLLSDFVSQFPAVCLWRNRASVIVGISQVVEDEVNLEFCNDKNISVVRRRTGGGAVFHDLGNLNYSFFFPFTLNENPYKYVYTLLQPAFEKLGIEISLSKTNDLLINEKKFSGMAERVIGDRLMVHGTILYDTDLDVMSKALTTDRSKFKKPRGVSSRRAEVVNIKDYLNDISNIHELEESLKYSLVQSSNIWGETISDDFLEKVRQRAHKGYAPISIKDTK